MVKIGMGEINLYEYSLFQWHLSNIGFMLSTTLASLQAMFRALGREIIKMHRNLTHHAIYLQGFVD